MHDLNISGVNSDSVITLMKSRIENYIFKSLEDGVSSDILRKELQDFNMNALIPVDIYQWCFGKLQECKKVLEPVGDGTVQTSPDDMQPLFSKDVVYHSSFCSFMISSAFERKCQPFSFSDLLNSQGHEFSNVSISSDNCFLVAQKQEIVYVAVATVGMEALRDGRF